MNNVFTAAFGRPLRPTSICRWPWLGLGRYSRISRHAFGFASHTTGLLSNAWPTSGNANELLYNGVRAITCIMASDAITIALEVPSKLSSVRVGWASRSRCSRWLWSCIGSSHEGIKSPLHRSKQHYRGQLAARACAAAAGASLRRMVCVIGREVCSSDCTVLGLALLIYLVTTLLASNNFL